MLPILCNMETVTEIQMQEAAGDATPCSEKFLHASFPGKVCQLFVKRVRYQMHKYNWIYWNGLSFPSTAEGLDPGYVLNPETGKYDITNPYQTTTTSHIVSSDPNDPFTFEYQGFPTSRVNTVYAECEQSYAPPGDPWIEANIPFTLGIIKPQYAPTPDPSWNMPDYYAHHIIQAVGIPDVLYSAYLQNPYGTGRIYFAGMVNLYPGLEQGYRFVVISRYQDCYLCVSPLQLPLHSFGPPAVLWMLLNGIDGSQGIGRIPKRRPGEEEV